MKPAADNYERREQLIAGLLCYGTWLASAIIAVGMILGSHDIVKIGVALFICLPVARVALLLVIFLGERDYAYVAISGLVLAIIGAGVLLGL
ncbi:DUF1634 domain-containing protein [Paradevosia shaoguanensis]|uniref:DUF1634 domain-containing protein n=1 Tax=Paradevosia shaoguanensis TaxID=1335043 RepID=A0AA41QLF0_9HYPH|nr:DUF1634 domain-containing protein [Paradevosia shaoguanensis]MCF1742155.1 DUF1634 domain-containing protein [Paradevosia shaoguanensis]MCI0126638.1 DUF1634 domain-containing protein [Paradevosia shaoguanensis]